MKKDLKLPAEVAEQYTLKDIEVGSYNFPGYGEVDLQNLTLIKAESLVRAGFPHLVPKKKNAAAADNK